MAKKQIEKPEILNVGPQYAKAFRAAIEATTKRLYVSNESIWVKDDGTVTIEPTRAIFLLTLGQEYQKQIDLMKKV
jgi:hypothetical protein